MDCPPTHPLPSSVFARQLSSTSRYHSLLSELSSGSGGGVRCTGPPGGGGGNGAAMLGLGRITVSTPPWPGPRGGAEVMLRGGAGGLSPSPRRTAAGVEEEEELNVDDVEDDEERPCIARRRWFNRDVKAAIESLVADSPCREDCSTGRGGGGGGGGEALEMDGFMPGGGGGGGGGGTGAVVESCSPGGGGGGGGGGGAVVDSLIPGGGGGGRPVAMGALMALRGAAAAAEGSALRRFRRVAASR